MDFRAELASLKQRLADAGVRIEDVLAIAGVHRSTWTRWTQTRQPRVDNWYRVQAAAELLLDKRRREAA